MNKASVREKYLTDLEEKGFDPEMLELLNEWELFRLHENLEIKNSIIQVTVALDLESFETDLPEIFQETKNYGEVITTMPDPDENSEKISFVLIYAGGQDEIAKLKKFFEQKSYLQKIKNLPT